MTLHIPSLFDMMKELIALPSISCVNPKLDQSNQAIIERLADWCHNLGFHCEILPIADHPNKFNLIATLGSGAGGLVLAGHTDTVPYDITRWQYDPFQLTEVDQRLYGLGIADMKSFFAFILEVAKQFVKQPLNQPLILLATADEESNMSGAEALLKMQRPQARYAIIGEPTGLRPVRMHKGIMMEAIRLRGLSGHSSDPTLGNNALEGMYYVMGALLAWRDELQARYHNPLFHIPVPTLNLGHIHGGDNPNRICGDCELSIDLRPLPGMELAELRAMLQQRVSQAITGRGLDIEFIPLFRGIAAMETPANAEIIQVAERLTQQPAQTVAFGTEAPFFQKLGMETLILGPGDIAQAHQPDEFIALDRIQPMLEILTKLVQHFCVNSHQ
ncbi:MAG: acetylornithine deacetylase [Beggiatoa sp. IS2]|nr:MAG: acetylornithine deacetylase [Beggiatoa sp. IS2]